MTFNVGCGPTEPSNRRHRERISIKLLCEMVNTNNLIDCLLGNAHPNPNECPALPKPAHRDACRIERASHLSEPVMCFTQTIDTNLNYNILVFRNKLRKIWSLSEQISVGDHRHQKERL